METLAWVAGGLVLIAAAVVLQWRLCGPREEKCEECRDSIGLEGLEEE